jgi:hypothetical protein
MYLELKNPQIPNITKIHPVRAEFYADGQTGMTTLTMGRLKINATQIIIQIHIVTNKSSNFNILFSVHPAEIPGK